MFVPLPSSDVCDLTSPSAFKIAQTVSRTWYNSDPSLKSIIPEVITFQPDGRGTISSSYSALSRDGKTNHVMTHDFRWKLARDGPLGMEGMDHQALFDTIPKLIRSEEAWTPRAWIGGFVPAYIHLDLVDSVSSEADSSPISDAFIIDSSEGTPLPPELLEYIFLLASEDGVAVNELTRVCKRSREMVMKRRRRENFALLTERFVTNGIALWITCGHFKPASDPSPVTVYAMEAQFFKFPPPCGYPEPQGQEWQNGWLPRRIYHSCPLPLPKRENPTFWRRLQGDRVYDAHPEVKKSWIADETK